MRAIEIAISVLRRASAYLAMAAGVYLLGVVAFNVAARAVFDATEGDVNFIIPGAIEQSTYALLVFVFASISASLPGGLVRVDLLISAFPRLLRRGLEILWSIVLVALAAALLWLFFEETAKLYERGDLTQDLRLPLWLFYALVTHQCAVIAAIALFGAACPSRLARIAGAEDAAI